MASMARTQTVSTASRSRSTSKLSARRSPPLTPSFRVVPAGDDPAQSVVVRWVRVADVEWADGPHRAQHAPGVFRCIGTSDQEMSTPSDPDVAGRLRTGGAGLGTSLGAWRM